MKRLSQETAHIQRRKKPAVIKARDLLKVTIPVITEDEAIGRKEKLLNTKLFGLFSPVKYEIKAVRKVYVPFELLIFSYEVNFGGKPRSPESVLHRDGQTAIVFNIKENHGFHFDLAEEIRRKRLEKGSLDGDILKGGVSPDDILEDSMRIVKQKVLRRVYRNVTNLKIVKRERFYRPACEITAECRGREFIKYAYMDEYTSSNEHISGLRTRLQN